MIKIIRLISVHLLLLLLLHFGEAQTLFLIYVYQINMESMHTVTIYRKSWQFV